MQDVLIMPLAGEGGKRRKEKERKERKKGERERERRLLTGKHLWNSGKKA